MPNRKPDTKTPEYRSASFTREAVDAEARTAELAFATTAPVERYFGMEVLEISENSMRTARLQDGAALLLDHDWREQIGVVEDVKIGSDQVARAQVRFGRGARAEEIFQDVLDGIRRHVSVGYRIHAVEERRGEGNAPDEIRVTDWEPYELSIVSVPADHTVGVGRSQEPAPAAPNPPAAAPEPKPEHEDRTMPEQNTPAGTAPASDDSTRGVEIDRDSIHNEGREAERTRVSELMKLGQSYSRFGGEKLAQEAIQRGDSVDQLREAILQNAGSKPAPDPEIGMSRQETEQFSVVRLLNALANPTDHRARESASFELEASRAAAEQTKREARGALVPHDVLKRELVAGTDSKGGDTVAEDLLAGSFIDLLRNRMVLSNLGVQMLGGLSGNVAIPKQTGGATAYWVEEGNSPTGSEQAFGQVALEPKTVAARTQMSRRLLLQSSIAMEGFVRNDLATVLALELERAAINGSGSNEEPEGVLNTTGIGSVVGGDNGGEPDWDDIVELETKVAVANAAVGNLGYLTNAAVRGKLLTTRRDSGSGQMVWADGETPLRGYRSEVTNAVPSNLTKGTGEDLSAILFGNWTDLLVGMWGGLDLQVDPYSAGNSGSVIVRVFQDADIAVRHAESFAAMKDAITQ